jgi:hypothetical protein
MEAKENIRKIPGCFNHRIYPSLLTDDHLKIATSAHEKKTEARQIGRNRYSFGQHRIEALDADLLNIGYGCTFFPTHRKPDSAIYVLPRMHRAANGQKNMLRPGPANSIGEAETSRKPEGETWKGLLRKVTEDPLLILTNTTTEKSDGSGETLHALAPPFLRFDRFLFKPLCKLPIDKATNDCPDAAAPSTDAGYSAIVDKVILSLIRETEAMVDEKFAPNAGAEGERVAMEVFKKDRFSNDGQSTVSASDPEGQHKNGRVTKRGNES